MWSLRNGIIVPNPGIIQASLPVVFAGFLRTRIMDGGIGRRGGWTPESPTSDGGKTPHTWHYASVDGNLYQDSGKTTVADADGDPIGASVNQGSDSHDVTQGNSTNKPTLKLNVKNGNPVLRYGGDYLQGAFNAGLSQPLTLFFVAKLDAAVVNDGSNHFITCDDDNAWGYTGQHKTTTPDSWGFHAGSWVDGGDSDDLWHIWTVLLSGASSQLWLDGVSEASGDVGSSALSGLTIGAYLTGVNSWDGDIAEILGYGGNLSTADKNQCAQYLADKYDLDYTSIP